MRETDTIHWVGPFQVIHVAKKREDHEKGLYTGRVRIYTSSFQVASLWVFEWKNEGGSPNKLQLGNDTTCI